MTKDDQIKKELLKIQKANRGILKPDDVVEFARDSNTALHSRFQWDDTKAAHEYRLWQAREIIRVVVIMLPNHNMETRAFVSLQSDRNKPGGGYRGTVSVMKSPDTRMELLGQALREHRAWEQKYIHLSELADVFKAAERVEKRIEKKTLRKTQAEKQQAAFASV